MKTRITLLVAMATLLAGITSAETFSSVPVVDVACASKVKANPDAHPRECALKCQKNGYGIIAPSGQFLKFDSQGNEKMLDLLKVSHQKDHLRVNVQGEVQGDTLKVRSVNLS
jgi:hypothetical protein